MKNEIKNIGIISIISVLVILSVWGWWNYYYSYRDLQSTIEQLRGTELTVQRITDGVSRLIEISRVDRISYQSIREELKQARGVIADYRRRDGEIRDINERGREDIERCIRLAQDYATGFERLYQEFRGLQTEGID